ncbi:hypothetical protein K4A83_17390 [Spirulina subsalsa FACHB-351]|uniref:Uncharacterized protein n=1 Tax=Spirulina subsalsa FACHB-351 TaxID=234711 RepID=A0ABT3L940_9CYAN|nr:hypothetical protein [Spirulina subsalsa]MCW6038032.1 hypothetical protein [Spirulina subsalsa FACHB-351]
MTTTSFDPQRSVASLTLGELEAFVRQTIQNTETSQRNSLIPPETNLDSSFDQSAQPFWQIVTESVAEVPDEVWETLPEDASEQIDHYLYHS